MEVWAKTDIKELAKDRVIEERGLIGFRQIEFLTMNETFKGRVEAGGSLFVSKKVKKGNTYEIVLNSQTRAASSAP